MLKSGHDESLYNKLRVAPETLLDEGKFRDFAKAAIVGTGLALSPLHAAGHEFAVSELPKSLIVSYNSLEDAPVVDYSVARFMADEIFAKVGEEAIHTAPENTKAWRTAQITYDNLLKHDDKVATAFLGKFNVQAKKLFGSQIRPKRLESKKFYPMCKMINEVSEEDEDEPVSDTLLADLIVNRAKTAGVVPTETIQDLALYVASYYSRQLTSIDDKIARGIKDLKSISEKLANGKHYAVSTTRSVMHGRPVSKQIEWIEMIKDAVKNERI